MLNYLTFIADEMEIDTPESSAQASVMSTAQPTNNSRSDDWRAHWPVNEIRCGFYHPDYVSPKRVKPTKQPIKDGKMVDARAQRSAEDIEIGLDLPDYVSDEDVAEASSPPTPTPPPQRVYPTSRKEDQKRWKREKREAAEREEREAAQRDGTAPKESSRLTRQKLRHRAREAAMRELFVDDRTKESWEGLTAQELDEGLNDLFAEVDEERFLRDVETVCGAMARLGCQ